MVQEHGRRIMRMAEQEAGADMILVDSGSNLGVFNRSILPAADYIPFPLGKDIFCRQYDLLLERPIKILDQWGRRIPQVYREAVLDESPVEDMTPENDPYRLATVKHCRTNGNSGIKANNGRPNWPSTKMDIHENQLKSMISQGEGMNIEFKAGRRQLPGTVYDTVCAFLNRNEDADLDITDLTEEAARLYQRKQAAYSENRVYPMIQPDSLRADLIDRCRRHIRINGKNHLWADMDNAELLQSAQLIQSDPETGKPGVTLAGVMLFGHDEQIRRICPAHRTDLLLRKVNTDRYDDRDLVITNIIDSYDRIFAFIYKHLPDPFYLEGIERRSLRDHIFREVASNMVIHREYASGAGSRLIIEYGRVVTDNPSRPHGFGILAPETCVPYQKNPVLSAFFREIDRADELGSGMRKMMRYGKRYGGADPQLIEGDNFRMIISIPELGEDPASPVRIVRRDSHSGQVTGQVGSMLLKLKTEKNKRELMVALKLTGRDNFERLYLRPALDQGLIEMTVPGKPKSRMQKYRLTAKGEQWIADNRG